MRLTIFIYFVPITITNLNTVNNTARVQDMEISNLSGNFLFLIANAVGGQFEGPIKLQKILA